MMSLFFFGGYSHSTEYIIHIGDYHNPSAGILIDQPNGMTEGFEHC